ncbi:MAG: 30S ribosomal protein S3, partial [Acidimicrobiia bacterium]
MGQKTHPYAFRLGIVTDWKSRWYSDSNYAELVNEDSRIRDYLRGELTRGAISRIEIERLREKIVVEIFTARPGVVIGRRGSEAERLRSQLEKLTGLNVKLNVTEIKDADTDAAILARGIADQLENRVAFRRAMKRGVQTAMKAGAEGVRIECKGRLGGADMGRREWYREGRVPLHTLRADVDYGTATAHTTVGTIGVKVWVYKGEVMGGVRAASERKIQAEVDMASGGGRRVATPKSRAEQAAGGDRMPRYIEAGGGKRRDADEDEAPAADQRAEVEAVDEIEELAEAAPVTADAADTAGAESVEAADAASDADAADTAGAESAEPADTDEAPEATAEVDTEPADADETEKVTADAADETADTADAES